MAFHPKCLQGNINSLRHTHSQTSNTWSRFSFVHNQTPYCTNNQHEKKKLVATRHFNTREWRHICWHFSIKHEI